jgi:hypothetical protein
MKPFCLSLIFTLALTAAAQDLLKLTGNDKVLNVKELSADAEGFITYSQDGRKKFTADPKTVDFAWAAAPAEIAEADKLFAKKDYVKADKAYLAAYEKYKFLGWEVYCTAQRAHILAKENRLNDSLILLEQLYQYHSLNPAVQKHIINAKKLYLDVLIMAKETGKAEKLANEMLLGDDSSAVFFAFCKKAEIANLENDRKKAVRYYLQAAYLFPDIPERPAAFYHAVILLKELKDKRWKNLANILEKKYPDSEYTRKL